MPTCSDANINEMVRNLYRVVTPSCAAMLDGLKFIVVGDNPFMKGNPGLFINKISKRGLVSILNNVREGETAVSVGNTIVVGRTFVTNTPLIYGVLIHEMGHAYCETSGAFANTEKNAYIFETNWLCRMAADPGHPYALSMRTGFKAYFAERIRSFQGAGVDKLHANNIERLGLGAFA